MEDNWKIRTTIFLSSQVLSLFGSSVVSYAVVWYITLKTGSATLMTISILAAFLPQIVISLFAGVWADRYNRKLLIIFSDLLTGVSTLILAIFFLMGYESITLIFIISAIRSIGSGIQTPAVGAILPQIVPMEKMTRINGINSALTSAMMLLSPAVAGIFFATLGFGYTLLLDVITAALAVTILSFLKVRKYQRKCSPINANSEKSTNLESFGKLENSTNPENLGNSESLESFENLGSLEEGTVSQLKEGLSYTRNNKLIYRILIFYAVFFFMVSPAAFLTPIMIARSFGAEIWRLTANEMFWTAGAIFGGVIVAWMGKFKDKIRILAISTLSFGFTFILLGLSTNFIFYLCVMFASGIILPFFSTAETVLILENVEEHMLGRVYSIVQIIVSSVMPLGMLLFGPLGDVIRIETILIGTGICIILLTPFIWKTKVEASPK